MDNDSDLNIRISLSGGRQSRISDMAKEIVIFMEDLGHEFVSQKWFPAHGRGVPLPTKAKSTIKLEFKSRGK